ncbi:hypothetical protein [Azospirillum agricola]|uniref:hypothetical protein n=1 Tax=Azospirillum agricola TaxID=1720247 RepID=UPI000A0EFA8D|nr:hypothetical protein [Azospirillum agricola]SMH62729.1 hypothetical protein SAMN02982994_6536 [Azospirillum lipoferum]
MKLDGKVKLPRPAPDRYAGLFADDENGRRQEVIAYHSRSHTVERIKALWERARDDFLAIGRWLVVAKARMEHGEFEAMVRAELPFSPSRARQLRTVAEFVDSGRIPLERLPPADSVIYEIATLSEDELAAAEPDIRPTLTRIEAKAFKKRVQGAGAPPASDRPALVKRIARLRQELAEAEAMLAALDRNG